MHPSIGVMEGSAHSSHRKEMMGPKEGQSIAEHKRLSIEPVVICLFAVRHLICISYTNGCPWDSNTCSSKGGHS